MATKTYEIPVGNFERLQLKLVELNKKCTKLGLALITAVVLATRRIAQKDEDTLLPKPDKVVYDVEVTGEIPKFAGWTLLAVIANEEGGVMVRKVGRNCLKDFLGHKDPHALAAMAEMLFALDDFCDGLGDEGGYGGGGGEFVAALEEFLTYTATAVRLDGWVSRGKARDDFRLQATADVVMRMMNPARGSQQALEAARECRAAMTDTDKETAKKALEFAKETLENDAGLNDFEHNLR